MKNLLKHFSKELKDSFVEFYKSKKFIKVLRFSALAFCFGLIVTTLSISFVNNSNKKNGVGGYETFAIPDFKEVILSDEESTLNSDSKNNIDNEELLVAQSLVQEEGEELVLQDLPEDTHADDLFLTYQTYRVKPGDMIGFIADTYGITQDTIISVNNIKQSRLIQVGQYLKIPSMPGILYSTKTKGETATTISEKYNVDAEKCALVNNIGIDKELDRGVSLFIPDAQLDWATRQEINGDLFRRPVRNRYYLSSYYGWRNSPFNTGKRSFHTGIDMACSTGTPIYPAMDGVVTATAYNSTYGNYVIVQHHSGYKTLYAHMSKITCKKGNFVYTSTQIGKVGSTGLSTGPHLHFTVYKNGKTVNPLGLIN